MYTWWYNFLDDSKHVSIPYLHPVLIRFDVLGCILNTSKWASGFLPYFYEDISFFVSYIRNKTQTVTVTWNFICFAIGYECTLWCLSFTEEHKSRESVFILQHEKEIFLFINLNISYQAINEIGWIAYEMKIENLKNVY